MLQLSGAGLKLSASRLSDPKWRSACSETLWILWTKEWTEVFFIRKKIRKKNRGANYAKNGIMQLGKQKREKGWSQILLNFHIFRPPTHPRRKPGEMLSAISPLFGTTQSFNFTKPPIRTGKKDSFCYFVRLKMNRRLCRKRMIL